MPAVFGDTQKRALRRIIAQRAVAVFALLSVVGPPAHATLVFGVQHNGARQDAEPLEPPRQGPHPSGPLVTGRRSAQSFPSNDDGVSDGTAGASSDVAAGGNRARAGKLANPSTTVPQGTMIRAVLETGLETAHSAPARAIVARDVRSFDGSVVLIPRGSRLIGEYDAGTSAGAPRAAITWTRLILPDGGTIAPDSPSADSLGRAGVRASVNANLDEGAVAGLLETAIGVALHAAAGSRNAILLNAPSSNGAANAGGRRIPRSATVSPGTTFTVVVAHDLEFAVP